MFSQFSPVKVTLPKTHSPIFGRAISRKATRFDNNILGHSALNNFEKQAKKNRHLQKKTTSDFRFSKTATAAAVGLSDKISIRGMQTFIKLLSGFSLAHIRILEPENPVQQLLPRVAKQTARSPRGKFSGKSE